MWTAATRPPPHWPWLTRQPCPPYDHAQRPEDAANARLSLPSTCPPRRIGSSAQAGLHVAAATCSAALQTTARVCRPLRERGHPAGTRGYAILTVLGGFWGAAKASDTGTPESPIFVERGATHTQLQGQDLQASAHRVPGGLSLTGPSGHQPSLSTPAEEPSGPLPHLGGLCQSSRTEGGLEPTAPAASGSTIAPVYG